MSHRQLDGLNIYYEVHGQGTPIVMIRVLGGDSDLGGGHQVLIEQPELCNEAILDFLKRCENN